MTFALKSWTTEEFFAWAEGQEGRHEFDGDRPVAMVGGTVNHAAIIRNLQVALAPRLRGSSCQSFGADAGVVTIGAAVRYPDALVTCDKQVGTARTVPGAVVIFEVVSPTSGRTDRITKVREYAAIASVRHYVILESTTGGLLDLHRRGAGEPWLADTLTAEDMLKLPEIGLEIPVAEFYEGVDFADVVTDA